MAKDAKGKGKRRSRGSNGDESLALVPDRLPGPPSWQRALARLTGARACYGKPIEAHGHVVIPVATMRTMGGLGFGGGPADDEGGAPGSGAAGPAAQIGGAGAAAQATGGGGGGFVDARPIGFIDIGPDGVRYQPIDVPAPPRRPGRSALVALALIVAARVLRGPASAGAARLRRGSAPAPWPVRSLRR